jgi:hypothetical protein
MKNFAVIPKKILICFWIFGSNITGSWFFKISPKFYFRKNYFETSHQRQMWDKPVFRKTLNIKIYSYLGTDIFLEVKFFFLWFQGLTGVLRNSEQRRTQTVVTYYHPTLKNHIFVPGLVMVDKLDLFWSSNKFASK